MDPVIQTSNLGKVYDTRTVVDHLSLHVERGEIYGFLGLNGAGKTTTIRMLLGMVRPSAGDAVIFGQRVHAGAQAIWTNVGYLVETPAAYSELTVRQNLEVVRRLRRLPDRKPVDRIIDDLGLTPYADRRAGTLSLGNLQRLGLAKALIHEPALLILDEPANGLDPAGVVEVRERLREMARERGLTVFMASHILSEVARLADRVGIIHHGHLIEEFRTDELNRRCQRWLTVDARDRHAAWRVLAGAGFAVRRDAEGAMTLGDRAAVDHPDGVSRLLVGAGVPPIKLAIQQEDLESYFLRLVTGSTEVAHA